MRRLLAVLERRHARITRAWNARHHQPITKPAVTTRRDTTA